MKMSKKVLAAVLCLALVLSLSTVAFAAAPMSTLVSTSRLGYTVIGRGSATSTVGTASLTASTSSDTPNIPSDDCSCSAKVEGYTSAGTYLGSSERTGVTSASATFNDSTGRIDYVKCTFTFVGQTYGPYNVTA